MEASLSVIVPGQARALSVHAQNIPSGTDSLILNVWGKTGQNHLDFTGLNSFSGTAIYLYDRYTRLTQNLNVNAAYSYNVTNDTLTQGGRFILIFTQAVTGLNLKQLLLMPAFTPTLPKGVMFTCNYRALRLPKS